MVSTFSWLDYSDHERQKVFDVVELLAEKSTVDELGIGGVRDAFADAWFPGTSTIQTVAKYFLIVPWTYLTLEKKSVPSNQIREQARKLEIKTIQSLVDSGGTQGVIGRVAKDTLKRLPSGTYWQGLGLWGIRRFPGSQDTYHRSIDSYYLASKGAKNRRSEFDGEVAEAMELNWDPELPAVPPEFPNGVSLELSSDEANYLRHRIINSCPNSMMAFLLRENIKVESESFLWDLKLDFPASLERSLKHGRVFSQVIHGAQLLYNVILADLKEWYEQAEYFQGIWNDWAESIVSNRSEIGDWKLDEFWYEVSKTNPRVGPLVRQFIEKWIELVRSRDRVEELRIDSKARDLVSIRERQIKKGLARVLGGRPLELWTGDSGSSRLDFRWRSARRIYTDLQHGLERE